MTHRTVDRPGGTVTAPPFPALLGRLVLGGVVAGVSSGTWQVLVTERAISPALAIEEVRNAGSGAASVEAFSRTTQMVGGFVGTILAAVVLAVVLAVVFAALRHRLPGRTDGSRILGLTAIGFGVVALLPAVAIPANPPAIGDPDTIGTRTAIYGAVLVGGLVLAALVAGVVGVLRRRGTEHVAVIAAGTAAGVALVILLLLVLPGSPDTVPADVPAGVVWDFRLASLGQLTVLWASLGLAGGWLVDRLATGPIRTR
nr:CbtA family protein [Modestobacter muralis]